MADVWHFNMIVRGLEIMRLVHFRAIMCTNRMIPSFSREIGWLNQFTIPIISRLLKEIEWLEMCTIDMFSKDMKISVTSKVYYFMVPLYKEIDRRL